MAGDDDKEGGDEGGGGGGGPPSQSPMLPVAGAPYAYPNLMLAPFTPTAEKDPIKLSEATPPQVRSELAWLVRTAKLQKMPVGVIATSYRLLMLILDDLEQGYRGRWPKILWLIPFPPWWMGPYHRLKRLRKLGAVTRGVVEEAALLRLEPSSRLPASYSAIVGDPADASRYVAFLRMLVDVAYEARAKYRKNQLPGAKTHATTTMTVTVGPGS